MVMQQEVLIMPVVTDEGLFLVVNEPDGPGVASETFARWGAPMDPDSAPLAGHVRISGDTAEIGVMASGRDLSGSNFSASWPGVVLPVVSRAFLALVGPVAFAVVSAGCPLPMCPPLLRLEVVS